MLKYCAVFLRYIIFPTAFLLTNEDTKDSFIGIGVFMFIVLPAIIVLINYYIVNRGDVFMYSFENSEVLIIHKGKQKTFNLDEIDNVKKYMSYNYAAKRAFITPWEGYNHSSIQLKNGERFTITSLLVPDLNLPLEEDKIVWKLGYYRLASTY